MPSGLCRRCCWRWPARRCACMPSRSPAARGRRPGPRGRPGPPAAAERGAVAALVALVLPVLILSAGLVVDVAYLFWMRAALQATADFAALAGAQNIDLEALAQGERRLLVEQAAGDA